MVDTGVGAWEGFGGILLPYAYSLLEKFHMQLIQENTQILKSDES